MPLKLLVLDAYTAKARTGLVASGATHAGELMAATVRMHSPDAQIDIIDFDTAPDDLADRLQDYDGVLWTGSNMTIHRRNALIDAQIDFAGTTYDEGTPQFGVCWGLQLATVAAGGDVQSNPNGREIAWARNIQANIDGRAHPFLAGKTDQFDALCWHSDAVVSLPDNATILASNDNSMVQAAILRRGKGEFWATQYHLEYDGHEVATLVGTYRDFLVKDGVLASHAEVDALIADMHHIKDLETSPDAIPAVLAPVADAMVRTTELGNWLRHISR
jgi:GMP synthase (glutamine-hydrolysing)